MTSILCNQNTFPKPDTTGAYVCDEFEIERAIDGIVIEKSGISSLAIYDVYDVEYRDTKYTLDNVPVFTIANNDMLVSLDLTGIHFMVDSSLTISNNPKLTSINLSELVTVNNKRIGGTPNRVTIEQNDALIELQLPKLQEMSIFRFALNKAAKKVEMPALVTADQLQFGNNSLIPDPIPVGPVPNPNPPLPPLARRRSLTAEEDCEALAEINLFNLRQVFGILEFANLCKLEALELPNLETVERGFTLADLTVEDVVLKKLATVGGKLEIQNMKSFELNFDELTEAGGLVIQRSHELTKALFPRLTTVAGPLTVYDNNAMTELNFDALKTVEGDLSLENLESLQFADLPVLETLGPDEDENYKRLTVRNTLVDAIKLAQIREFGFLYARDNAEMLFIELGSQLNRLTNGMEISKNDKLERINMLPFYKGELFGVVCEEQITIDLNDALSIVDLKNLDTLQSNLTIEDNPLLKKVTTNLQAVLGEFNVVRIELNDQLKELNFPYLAKIEGGNGRGFITDLDICINNDVPHAVFQDVTKCNVPGNVCEAAIGGGGVFGILLAVFVGLAIALAGGYYWGRRTVGGGKSGYSSVN